MRAALAIALLISSPALAHSHGEHADWFRSLNIPGVVASCCSDRDCAFTDDWRIRGGGYEVRLGGEWRPVPPDRVLHRKDSPQARATVCVGPAGGIICFVPGAGA